MSKKINQKLQNKSLLKTLVLIAVFSASMMLMWTYMSVQEPEFGEGTQKYTFQNIGTVFFGIYALVTMVLATRFPLYWTFMSKGDRAAADERQTNVRRRVYETAYRLFAIVSVGAYWIFNHPDPRMATIIGWFVGLTYLSLPLLLAAWRKDS